MTSKTFRLAVLVGLFAGLGLSGCSKKQQMPEEEQAQAETPEQQQRDDEQTPGAEGEEGMQEGDGKVEVAEPHSSSVPGTQNQLEWDQDVPEVSMRVVRPNQGQVLQSGDEVSVEVDLQNYRTGEAIGQHVHIILDNEPYRAHYNADEPFVLEDVEPGTHTLRIFPARHYHLSLKQGDVFKTVTFHVEEESEDFTFDDSEPFITYSRPKGSYSVEAAKELLLDFYVSNVELGEDAKVVYGIDGEEQTVTEWKPVLLPELAPGEHTITLKLVDGDGNVIENGGYNNTTRTITVEEG